MVSVTCYSLSVFCMHSTTSWEAMLYGLIGRYQRFGGACCLCLLGRREDNYMIFEVPTEVTI